MAAANLFQRKKDGRSQGNMWTHSPNFASLTSTAKSLSTLVMT
jgi:hypothetical protein